MKRMTWILAVVAVALIIYSPCFAGVPPNEPENPTPADGDVNVDKTVRFKWECSDPDFEDSLSYELWMHRIPDNWPEGVPYTGLFQVRMSEPLTVPSWTIGCLQPNKSYVWAVVAVDLEGNRKHGPLWYFTTGMDYFPHITSIWPNPAKLGEKIKIYGCGFYTPGDRPLGIAINNRVFRIDSDKVMPYPRGHETEGDRFYRWDECVIEFELPNPTSLRNGWHGQVTVRVGLRNEYGEIEILTLDEKLVLYKYNGILSTNLLDKLRRHYNLID